ncbi:MAG: HAMP domain-containing histidine kinase, partial [Halioglobus sp.]|nr:HAMP domain-containing histidine kinase [Halioglobus sp.]
LNNAADTGSQKIALQVAWNDTQVQLKVRDWGPGIAANVIEQIGKPIIHTDRGGLGIGLMLSLAAVERAGGSVQLRNHPDGGALATLLLPHAGASL